MGISSLNPFTIISNAIVRITQIIFSKIAFCSSSCCQSQCRTNNTPMRRNNINAADDVKVFDI